MTDSEKRLLALVRAISDALAVRTKLEADEILETALAAIQAHALCHSANTAPVPPAHICKGLTMERPAGSI